VEEIAKFLAVAWYAQYARYKYILNGLLFGAAVGAGFEIFENAGYAFETAHRTMAVDAIEGSLLNRGLTAPFCHIVWTSISAAALWRARGDQPLSASHFLDPGFLRAFLVPVGLHMIWNSPIPNPFHLKDAMVGLAGWFVVLGLVQQGLRQVRYNQMKQARQTLSGSRVA
jgi:RsiW-degrading membrane proteinase PrsW (M82 family)